MSVDDSRHRWWLPLLAVTILGAGGCPTSMGCGVSGSMPGSPQGMSAQSWTCQASIQLAKGATISSPGAAKAELVAQKESTAIQVAGLRNQLEDRGFGFAGKDAAGQTGTSDPMAQELTKLMTKSDQLDRQIKSIDSLQLPDDAIVLKDGTWTVDGDQVTLRTTTFYNPGQKVIVPYVIRSGQGEIVDLGYLPVESIRVQQQP